MSTTHTPIGALESIASAIYRGAVVSNDTLIILLDALGESTEMLRRRPRGGFATANLSPRHRVMALMELGALSDELSG